jgi:ATP-dependent Lon protease
MSERRTSKRLVSTVQTQTDPIAITNFKEFSEVYDKIYNKAYKEAYTNAYEEDDNDDPDYTPKTNKSSKYTKDDTIYYEKLTSKKRKIIDKIEIEIANINKITIPLRFKILDSNIDIKLKAIALHKVDQLANMKTSDNEYFKLKNYIENLSKIPIGKFKQLPISNSHSVDKIKTFLDTINERLDKTVYGHIEAKEQIIRLLAKWISNPNSGGLVIGMQGSMGVGKTTFAKQIAENLNMPMSFISLGTCSCSTDLIGSSYVYEGSRWGRLVAETMKAEFMNPVMFFDELDKISQTKHGEEITNILIHLTDSTQNMKFHDRYFSDLDLDFSKSLMIFSYNNEELINPILKDRMVTINIRGYNSKEKIKISQDYLLPAIFTEYGFEKNDIIFEDDIIKHIITLTEEEEGVRNLKRSLEVIISQINLHKILKKQLNNKDLDFPIIITQTIIDKFIKIKENKFTNLSMYI